MSRESLSRRPASEEPPVPEESGEWDNWDDVQAQMDAINLAEEPKRSDMRHEGNTPPPGKVFDELEGEHIDRVIDRLEKKANPLNQIRERLVYFRHNRPTDPKDAALLKTIEDKLDEIVDRGEKGWGTWKPKIKKPIILDERSGEILSLLDALPMPDGVEPRPAAPETRRRMLEVPIQSDEPDIKLYDREAEKEEQRRALDTLYGLAEKKPTDLPTPTRDTILPNATTALLGRARQEFGIELNADGSPKKQGFFKRLFGKGGPRLETAQGLALSQLQIDLKQNYAENKLSNAQLLQKAKDIFGITVGQDGTLAGGFLNRNIRKYRKLSEERQGEFDALLSAVESTYQKELPLPPRRLADNKYVSGGTAATAMAAALSAGPTGLILQDQRQVEREFKVRSGEFEHAMKQADLDAMRANTPLSYVDVPFEHKPLDPSKLQVQTPEKIHASKDPFVTKPGSALDERAQKLLAEKPTGGVLSLGGGAEAKVMPFGKSGNEVTVYIVDKASGQLIRSGHFVDGVARGERVYTAGGKLRNEKGDTKTLRTAEAVTRQGSLNPQIAEDVGPRPTIDLPAPPAPKEDHVKKDRARLVTGETGRVATRTEPEKATPAAQSPQESGTKPTATAEKKAVGKDASRYQSLTDSGQLTPLPTTEEIVAASQAAHDSREAADKRAKAKERMVEYRASLPEPLKDAYDKLAKLGSVYGPDSTVDHKKLDQAKKILHRAAIKLKALEAKGEIAQEAVRVVKTQWEKATPEEIDEIIADLQINK